MKQVAVNVVIISAIFIIQFQPALAQFYFDGYDMPEKKSHQGMADFTNALNGAARLRYGKRSSSSSAFPSEQEMAYEPEARAADWIPRFQSKRSPANSLESMPQFLQSLNGAERLRFG